MNPNETLFILVHDAWHGGWAWEKVAEEVAARGWNVVALDLPGHGLNPVRDNNYARLTLKAYAATVGWLAKTNPDMARLVLVGHGTAGPVLQLAAEQLGERVAGLVFVGAYILQDGESIAGQMPSEMYDFFKSLSDASPDGRLDMAQIGEFWRYNFCNDAQLQADDWLARLVPESAGPLFEKIQLKTFFQQAPPSAYLSFNEDMSLPPGEFHPRMPNKLGPYHHININAGHEGILTKPREVAEALVFLASQIFGGQGSEITGMRTEGIHDL